MVPAGGPAWGPFPIELEGGTVYRLELETTDASFKSLERHLFVSGSHVGDGERPDRKRPFPTYLERFSACDQHLEIKRARQESGDEDLSQELFTLAVFALWYGQFIEPAALPEAARA